jgi:hypothetical protein
MYLLYLPRRGYHRCSRRGRTACVYPVAAAAAAVAADSCSSPKYEKNKRLCVQSNDVLVFVQSLSWEIQSTIAFHEEAAAAKKERPLSHLGDPRDERVVLV